MKEFDAGVDIHKVLMDLKHIRLTLEERGNVLSLLGALRSSDISHNDETWARSLYRLRKKRIQVLHESYASVKTTDAEIKTGSKNMKALRLMAKRVQRKRLEEKKARLESELHELDNPNIDYGF